MSSDRTASRRFSASLVKLSRSVGSPGLLVTGLLQVTTVPLPKELYSPRHAMRDNSVCRRMELSRLTDLCGQRFRNFCNFSRHGSWPSNPDAVHIGGTW